MINPDLDKHGTQSYCLACLLNPCNSQVKWHSKVEHDSRQGSFVEPKPNMYKRILERGNLKRKLVVENSTKDRDLRESAINYQKSFQNRRISRPTARRGGMLVRDFFMSRATSTNIKAQPGGMVGFPNTKSSFDKSKGKRSSQTTVLERKTKIKKLLQPTELEAK